MLGSPTDEEVRRVDALREQWREANVGSDPLSVIAASLRGIEEGMRRDGDMP